MVLIPAGTFWMGSPDNEEGRSSGEGPRRRVAVDAFAAGVHEVTFAEWDACVAAGGCGGYRPVDQGWGRRRRPVINVSWQDAQGYTQWLTRRTGQRYRLLSEAEWEYAARAGTDTPFWFGATITTDQANYDGNHMYGAGRKGVYRQRTVEVGSFPKNGFGLQDMHGNVWEWVEDCYRDSYRDAPETAKPVIAPSCERRVLRGGSWLSLPRDLRSANRYRFAPEFRYDYAGFRVARTPGL